MKKYTIEVTERQMNLIANACELSSRLRSGQFHELRDIFHDLECTLGGADIVTGKQIGRAHV